MGLRINNQLPALTAQRNLLQTVNRSNERLEQLASGLRINRAAQDAAGLAIAEGFRASVRQLNQEVNNLQSGVNVTQTADAALGQQQEITTRLRELSVQASNGTLSDDQRAAINAEAQQLVSEIDNIANDTEFNGQALLDGSAGTITLDPEGANQVEIGESTVDSLGLNGLDLSTQAGAQGAVAALDNASEQISTNRANVGAQENRLETAINQRTEASVNLQDAESRIRDLDVARAFVDQTRNQVLLQSGVSALAQGNLEAETALTLLGQ